MLRPYDSYCFSMIRDPGWAQILTLIGSSDRALCSNPDTCRVFPGAGLRETDASPHEDGRPFLFQAPLVYSLAPLLSLAVPAQVSQHGVTHMPPDVAPLIRCLLVLLFVSSSCGALPSLFHDPYVFSSSLLLCTLSFLGATLPHEKVTKPELELAKVSTAKPNRAPREAPLARS